MYVQCVCGNKNVAVLLLIEVPCLSLWLMLCLSLSLSSRVKTASGFPSWWVCGSSSSLSSCCATYSLVTTSPCCSPTTPGTSSSWYSSPSPTDTWPVSACASDPSKNNAHTHLEEMSTWRLTSCDDFVLNCFLTPDELCPSVVSVQEGTTAWGGDGGGHHGLLLVPRLGAGRCGLICFQGHGLKSPVDPSVDVD